MFINRSVMTSATYYSWKYDKTLAVTDMSVKTDVPVSKGNIFLIEKSAPRTTQSPIQWVSRPLSLLLMWSKRDVD